MTQNKPGTALALLANRLQVSEAEVKQSLTQTVFKGANEAQMTALLVVANEYSLNPFTKELYAFPSKGGIVPMVSIDGWLRIINEHPEYAGMDIVYAENVVTVQKSRPCPEYIEVTIHRKDRPHTSSAIREYLDECYRNTEPWNMMTRRMLRHKAIKEAGRVTMGLHGIFDEDEARDVLEREGKTIVVEGEAYEVGEKVDPIADPEALAELLALAATKTAGNGKPVSQKAIIGNLKRQYGYEGTWEEIPESYVQATVEGLRQLEDAVSEPTGENPTAEVETSKPAKNARLAKLCILWTDVIAKDLDDEASLRAWLDSAYGTSHRNKLTAEQQGEVIEALERALSPGGEA